jgi:hypothetical protein
VTAEVPEPSTLAYRLLDAALCGPHEPLSAEWMADELVTIPSGSARLAVMQSVAFAALVARVLAEAIDCTAEEVLRDLWPGHERSSSELREIAAGTIGQEP